MLKNDKAVPNVSTQNLPLTNISGFHLIQQHMYQVQIKLKHIQITRNIYVPSEGRKFFSQWFF
jgi:hypothetical protein